MEHHIIAFSTILVFECSRSYLMGNDLRIQVRSRSIIGCNFKKHFFCDRNVKLVTKSVIACFSFFVEGVKIG